MPCQAAGTEQNEKGGKPLMEGCADVSRAGFDSRPWRQGGLAHGPVHSFLLFPAPRHRRGAWAGAPNPTRLGFMLRDMAFGRACQTGAGFKSPVQPNRTSGKYNKRGG